MRVRRSTAIVALVSAVACGSNQAPTAPMAAVASGITVKDFAISGNLSLTAVGQTSQLTATATFSDGTVKEVTGEARWTSDNPAVVIVSATGFLTAVRFGAIHVQASYQATSKQVSVRVTPSGTFTVSGWIREPGQGLRLENVRVLETLSGATTMTSAEGKFSIAALVSAHLRFEKPAYEPAEMDPTPDGEDNVAMQRVVHLIAGQTVTPVPLAPHDMDYIVAPGTHCYPCRLIRVVVPRPGMLHLGLTWSESRSSLGLWAGSQRFLRSNDSAKVDADVPVNAGEVIVYVGQVPASQYHVPFMLATLLVTERTGRCNWL